MIELKSRGSAILLESLVNDRKSFRLGMESSFAIMIKSSGGSCANPAELDMPVILVFRFARMY